jgi:molybdate transport system substrate-binding protein
MSRYRMIGLTAASIVAQCWAALPAGVAEIKVLSAIAMMPVMQDLGPKFEKQTGHKLAVTFATLGQLVKRIQDGETADLVILPRQGIDSLVKEGKAIADMVAVLARSDIGIAVRKGASKPDISSPEALKRTLLAAKSIAYVHPDQGGTSGPHFVRVLDRLGIAADIKAKTIFPKEAGGKAVGALVAAGEAEIGVNQIQELIPLEGIDVVGPFPTDLLINLVFAATLMSGAKQPDTARALLDFLRTPQSAAVITAKGMQPVR